MKLIQIDKENGHAWFWKFLTTWRDSRFFIGFYHDYENCDNYLEIVWKNVEEKYLRKTKFNNSDSEQVKNVI